MCEANNLRPPFTVRVNTMKTTRKILQERLAEAGVPSLPASYSPEGLILQESFWPPEEPLFQEGFYFVQDEASQIVAHVVNPRPGERVLDACAAPGGKTTHLAQLMKDQGEIVSLDLPGPKIDWIRDNCRRMGIRMVTVFEADASKPLPFPEGLVFDRILVDAPCTGLGTLHRHPEAKWLEKPRDAERLRRLQLSLLENLWVRLKTGGILVYSTCTVTREENDVVVEGFLRTHKEFQLEDLRLILPQSLHPLIDEKGFLRTYPGLMIARDRYRMDGFFAARVRRK